jgi:hypothetical protein
MCTPASFVVTKNGVYWSRKSDSHEDIIEENGLSKLDRYDPCGLVRVEITPPNMNFLLPISEWEVKIDQDVLPEWYVHSDVVGQCMEQLPNWVKSKIIFPDDVVKVLRYNVVAIYGKVDCIRQGVSVVYILGDAVVHNAYGATIDDVLDNARICYAASCRVSLMSGSSRIDELSEFSYVQAMTDKSTIVKVAGFSTINAMTDSSGISILSGHSRVCCIEGSAYISEMRFRSVVERVYKDARIGKVSENATVSMFSSSVPIDEIGGMGNVMSFTDMVPEVMSDSAILVIIDFKSVGVLVGESLAVVPGPQANPRKGQDVRTYV